MPVETEIGMRKVELLPALTRGILDKTFFAERVQMEQDASKELILGRLEQEKLGKIIQVLEHPGLKPLIDEGKITLGAIKPRTEDSKLGVESDEEGEKMLLEMIKPPLEREFTISVLLTPEDLDVFYSEVKEKLSKKKDIGQSKTRWDLFKDYMLSGPVTYFLLYNPKGNAVAEWRKQIGKTNPKDADPDTIRGKYADSIDKNLVHGSSGDTAQEQAQNVKKEVHWLASKLKTLKKEKPQAIAPINEGILRGMDIVGSNEQILSIGRFIKCKRAGAEIFLSAYAITVQNESGETDTRYLAQKSVFSMGGDCAFKAEQMFERLKLLQDAGLSTPKLFGTYKADILEEFILNAGGGEELVSRIKSENTPLEVREALFKKLVHMATVLDKQGFELVGDFWRNLIFDEKDIYFVDGGFDLGAPNPAKSSTTSTRQLVKEFQGLGFDHLLPNA